jgi:hypothetical protein
MTIYEIAGDIRALIKLADGAVDEAIKAARRVIAANSLKEAGE